MKKILSIVVVVMMLMSCLSLSVFAADNYAWQWNDNSGAYLYINGYGDSPAIIEFDVRFDNGGEQYRINGWMGNSICIEPANGTIGVGGTTLTRQFSAATWYHVKFDGTSGSGTAIYVDGSLIGNVGTTVTSTQCCGVVMVTIDNFQMTVNGNTVINDDFQDKDFDGVNSDTNGTWVIANDLISGDDPTPTVCTHVWDAGVVQGNYILYTCTICGETKTEAVPNPDDLGWWLRIDGYGHVQKNVDRCDGPAVQNCGYVDFDLIMLPGDNGHCQIRFFDSYEGSTRTYLEDNRVGYHYTYTEDEGFSSFSWGDMTVSNVRHVRYAYTDEDVTLYVDGSRVYTNNHGCTPAMNGLVFYVESGSAIIDNIVFSDTKGNTMYSNNFESNAGDNDSQQGSSVTRIHLGDCANGNHVAANNSRVGLAPTCTENGYRYWPCIVCGNEATRETIDKLGHNFGTYAQGVTTTAATASADGVKTWTCTRCSAATATGAIPATGSYTGTIYSFDDASDENVTKYILKGFSIDPKVDENDGLSYPGDVNMTEDSVSFVREYTTSNYHQFTDIPTAGYTVAFDFRLQEVYDTSDTEGYGHTFYFWVGGNSNVGNNIGYDFETNEFYAEPSTGTNYDRISGAASLPVGEWHNVMFKFYSNSSTFESYAALYLDGVEKMRFDGDDASFELPYDANTQYFPLLFRTFGVKADYTNFVIGDINFNWLASRTPENAEPHEHVWGEWVVTTPAQVGVPGVETRTCSVCGATETRATDPLPVITIVEGDVNGDGKVNGKDLLLMKKRIIGDVTDNDIVVDNSDLNGDGKINSKDVKLLRARIANG
jgi:hypothetical protein